MASQIKMGQDIIANLEKHLKNRTSEDEGDTSACSNYNEGKTRTRIAELDKQIVPCNKCSGESWDLLQVPRQGAHLAPG